MRPILGPAKVRDFWRRGFLQVSSIIGPEERLELRCIVDRLFERRAGWSEGDQFDMAGTDAAGEAIRLPQLLDPAAYAPELADLPLRRRARSLAEQLLGVAPTLQFEHAIWKPPVAGAATAWHQDEAFWDPAFGYESVSVWVPLQAATIDNGCLHFVPGSHRGGVLPHRPLGGDPRVHGLEVETVETAAAVACPVAAGGATIHHCRTLHSAGENRAEEARISYTFVFGRPPARRSEARRFPWLEERRTAGKRRQAAARARGTDRRAGG